ncbi:MAG: hypothetical protein LV479_05795 [Methylacidiphilales bacterium]|nr:hypothetical protein [Candidatus Methylacidiphilales bacterium]
MVLGFSNSFTDLNITPLSCDEIASVPTANRHGRLQNFPKLIFQGPRWQPFRAATASGFVDWNRRGLEGVQPGSCPFILPSISFHKNEPMEIVPAYKTFGIMPVVVLKEPLIDIASNADVKKGDAIGQNVDTIVLHNRRVLQRQILRQAQDDRIFKR